MASTLTVAQKIVVFSILETPYAGYVDQKVGEFGLSAVTRTPNSDSQKLASKINSRLAELVSEEEAVLVGYIAKWQLLGTNTAEIDAGSVGGVNGATYSPNSERGLIQMFVKSIIPVMEYKAEIQLGRESSRRGGMNMSTTR